METIWAYEDNVFLNVTDHNYELMSVLSEFHVDALTRLAPANPFFQQRLDFYQPLHDAYIKVYNAWKLSGGKQKSDTLTVNQLLALRTQKLNGWEPKITSVFLPGTPGYVLLFPQSRYPFVTGSKDKQIAAFKTLADAMTPTAALKDVQTDVMAYWQQLNDQRSLQQQSKGAKGSSSDDVEAARLACGDGMFCNLGNAMAFYYLNRMRIGGLFDLQNIRYHQQITFQRQVKPLQNLFVVKHKFAATEQITCINKGVTQLAIYEGDSKTTPFNEAGCVFVEPGQTLVIEAGKLGAPDKAFLFLYNPDTINDGECEIDFM